MAGGGEAQGAACSLLCQRKSISRITVGSSLCVVFSESLEELRDQQRLEMSERVHEICTWTSVQDYIERTVRDEVEIFTQDRILREDVNVGIDYEKKPPNRLTNSNTFHPITARLDIRILIFFVREWKDKRAMKERTVCLRGEIEESSRMGFAREKGSSASSLSYRSCSRDKGNSGTVRKKLRLTPLYDLLVGMLVVGGVGGGGR
ncbi:hypothetical protein V1477_016258 [Vespula maculifrons]|uniref:Uncharacterized protein n=1 Tax=Vespula maculifrons TaxID=7453 RepID=A0ABD2BCI3_VESMC